MAQPTRLSPIESPAEYEALRTKTLKELGLYNNVDNQLKFGLLYDNGRPLDSQSFGKSAEEQYREIKMGGPSVPPKKPATTSTLTVNPAQQAPNRSSVQTSVDTPLDTTGGVSALGNAARKLSGIWQTFDEQVGKRPEDREGLAGVAASLAPQRVPTTKAGGYEPTTEGELMYLFRLLNIPSSVIAAGGETLYERVAGTGEKGSLSEEMAANFSRVQSKGEGLAEVGAKLATLSKHKLAEALTDATGKQVTPEQVERTILGIVTAGGSEMARVFETGVDNIAARVLPQERAKAVAERTTDPTLENLGWLAGLGADILTPSTGEVMSIAGLGRAAPPLAPKETPVAKLDRTVEENFQRVQEDKVADVTWDTQRRVEAQPPFTEEPTRAEQSLPGETTPNVLLTREMPTVEQVSSGRRVFRVTSMPDQGRNVVGIEYILDEATGRPVPASINLKIEDPDALAARASSEDVLKGDDGALLAPQRPEAGRLHLEADVRQLISPEVINNKHARYTLANRARRANLINEYRTDIFGTDKAPAPKVSHADVSTSQLDKDPQLSADLKAARKMKAADYYARLTSLDDRWKFHARKADEEGAFADTAQKLARQQAAVPGNLEVMDVFKGALIDTLVEPVRMGKYLLLDRRLGSDGKSIAAPIVTDAVVRELTAKLRSELGQAGTPTADWVRTSRAALVPMLREGVDIAIDDIPHRVKLPTDAIDNLLDEEKVLVRTWYEASSEAVAQELIDEMGLPVGAITAAERAYVKEALGLDDAALLKIARQHITSNRMSPDMAYRNFATALAQEANQKAGNPIHSPDQVYFDLHNNRILYPLMRDINRRTSELALWEMVRSTVGSHTSRERLANALASSPMLAALYGKLPEKVRLARSRTLVDNIAADVRRNPEDAPWVAKLLVSLHDALPGFGRTGLVTGLEWVGNHSSFLKNQLLAGGVLPNPRNLVGNFIGAPTQIYQQLGLLPALGATMNLWKGWRLAMDISNYQGTLGRLAPAMKATQAVVPAARLHPSLQAQFPKGLRYGDLRSIVLDNNITKGIYSYETSGDVLQSMVETYLQAKQPNKWEAFRKYVGLTNNPSTWNSVANDTDVAWRTGVLVDSLERGETLETAVRKAREALFDYGQIKDWEKNVFANWVWFYSFQRLALTNTLRALATGKGQTRIKNLLMLTQRDLAEGQGDAEFGVGRSRFKVEPSEQWSLYGPEVPAASALKLMGEAAAFAYWLLPHSSKNYPGIGGGSAYEAQEVLLDTAAQRGINPYLDGFVNALSEGKWDLRARRNQGKGPDPRITNFYRWARLLNDDGTGPAAELFSLVPDYEGRAKEGQFSDNPDQSLEYKFGNDAGRNNYAIWQRLVWDLTLGASRTTRDWTYFVDPRYSLPINLGTGIGIYTPYQEETLMDQRLRRERDLQERYLQK